ncbi:MAG: hypothetical protein E7240_00760 [Lachnospiraceae bacterium]|nr:hypothetical protein [Lachnospiraceae bacterium]
MNSSKKAANNYLKNSIAANFRSAGSGAESEQNASAKTVSSLKDVPDEVVITPEKQKLFDLIDRAAVGDLEAAGEIAEGYFLGTFEDVPNYEKARKWSHYAAKKGNAKGIFVQEELKKLGY